MNAMIGESSVRRTTSKSRTVSVLEVDATKASHKAYIASIKAGHEEIIETLRTEHDEEIAALKTHSQHDNKALKDELSCQQQAADAKQQAAATEAKQKPEDESIELNRTLKENIKEAQTRIEALKTRSRTEVKRRRELQEQNETLQAEHTRATKKLKAELAVGPNAWLQLHFRAKVRPKQRTYFHRYTATMNDAAKELLKDLGKALPELYNFHRREPTGSICSLSETLQQASTLF